jgi:hypothetical protein
MSYFYDSAPLWNSKYCPMTCPTAKPMSLETVRNVSVIDVKGAMYRNASISGVFLLANAEVQLPQRGRHRVKVFCRWFDHRLPSGVPIALLVDCEKAAIRHNYIGEVVSNISR